MKFTLKAYKKRGHWYNDDPENGFSESQNELVAGVPEVIERFVGTASRAKVDVSTTKFKGSLRLMLVDDDVAGGMEYMVDYGWGDKNPIIWICEVTWFYFGESAPENLYIKIRGV